MREQEQPLPLTRLAAAQGIPDTFLVQILRALRQAGLVRSFRGTDGGYRLEGAPEAISVATVIRAVEGPLLVAPMPGGERSSAAGRSCSRLWGRLRERLEGWMEEITLDQLLDEAAQPSRPMFHI